MQSKLGTPQEPEDNQSLQPDQTQQRPAHVARGAEPAQKTQSPSNESHNQQPKSHVGKTLVVAALAGIIGGGAVSGVLFATRGYFTHPAASATQNITINPDSEDTSVATAVAAKVLPSVVSINVTTDEGSGIGSGVVYDSDGDIITNYHVAGDASSISVSVGGKSYTATYVGGDASSDIAVIKADFEGDSVTPIQMGDSSQVSVGEWVMTAGTPFGLDQSVSAGIVSALSRNDVLQSQTGNTIYTNLIQVDAAINPGNSGGALVNQKGELIGITTLFTSDSQSFAGIGYAIPSNYAKRLADDIIAGKQVLHAYLGTSTVTVNATNAEANNLPVNQGAYVAEVVEGSPADAAGLKAGDIITKIGSYDVTSAQGVVVAVRSYEIGDKITLEYYRDGKKQSTDVTLGNDESLQKQQQDAQKQKKNSQNTNNYNYNNYNNNPNIRDIINQLYGNGGTNGGSYIDTRGSSDSKNETSDKGYVAARYEGATIASNIAEA